MGSGLIISYGQELYSMKYTNEYCEYNDFQNIFYQYDIRLQSTNDMATTSKLLLFLLKRVFYLVFIAIDVEFDIFLHIAMTQVI